jgi:multiple sugar transport system ATP-binding protein
MAQVSLKGLKRFFGRVMAVENFSLDIKDGEFVVFVGPSGCGKTTTLRMIAGLEETDEGEIYIGDRLVNDLPPKDRNVAMVFQNYALYPHMNVSKNMAFGLKLRKTPKMEIEKRVREAAEVLGLEELLDRKPKQLSGGQMQRVAVGRAFVREADVYLFDEPMSNLDAKLRVQMRNELARLHHKLKRTMIYVTHDQVEAMTLGDRIVVMKDGLIQQVGSPLDVYESPVNIFVAGFLGNPSMNFFEGTIVKEGSEFFFKREGLTLKLPDNKVEKVTQFDREIILGLRPDNVRIKAEPAEYLNTIEVVAEVVESLGSETLIVATVSNLPITAKEPEAIRLKYGQKVLFHLDLSMSHIFDKASGDCITG